MDACGALPFGPLLGVGTAAGVCVKVDTGGLTAVGGHRACPVRVQPHPQE